MLIKVSFVKTRLITVRFLNLSKSSIVVLCLLYNLSMSLSFLSRKEVVNC